MASNEAKDLAMRALNLAARQTPGDTLFAFDLAESLDDHHDIEVHAEYIERQSGPLGGVSTRIPITYTDMIGRTHCIMVQAYCDSNIREAFQRLGLLEED